MNRFLLSWASLWLVVSIFAIEGRAQQVTVTASHTADVSGKPLNGTVFFQPVASDGQPLGFRVAGQTSFSSVSAPVTNGAFSLSIADTTQTKPANICYRVWATNAQKEVVLGSKFSSVDLGYSCVQVQPAWCSNGTCNFDQYQPLLAAGRTTAATINTYDLLGAAAAAQSAAETYAQALVAALPASSGQGSQGSQGPVGPAGQNGESAFQLATDQGFSGSLSSWLASLVGPIGPQGPSGDTGATGPQGATGQQGNVGAAGAQGPKGDTGATGAAGATGATGAPGSAATVAIGTVTTGAAGSNATVTNTGTSSAAVFNFSIPQGPTGATGVTGAQGPAGPTGATGAQGPAGNGSNATIAVHSVTALAAGATPTVSNSGTATNALLDFGIPAGATGAQGTTGASGSPGANGESAYQVALDGGFSGTQAQWLASLVGAQGSTGATGAQGGQGATGSQGAQGATGATGATGPTGVLNVANDTNVTGSVNTGTQTLTLGWQGTLAKTRLLGTTVFTDQANTFTANLQDFSAATLKLPVASSYAPTINGLIGYDSTNNKLVAGVNAAAYTIPVTNATTTNFDCAIWTLNAGRLGDNACALLAKANTFGAGYKQTFTGSSTTAGLNVAPQSSVPSSVAAGDLFYLSSFGAVYVGTGTNTYQSLLTATALPNNSVTYASGYKQTFTPASTNAGVNLGSLSADPTSLVAGDFWLRSDLKNLSYSDGSATHRVLDATTTLAATTLLCTDASGQHATTAGCPASSGGGSSSITFAPPYLFDGTNYRLEPDYGFSCTKPSGLALITGSPQSPGLAIAMQTNGNAVMGDTANNGPYFWGKSTGTITQVEGVLGLGHGANVSYTQYWTYGGIWMYDSSNHQIWRLDYDSNNHVMRISSHTWDGSTAPGSISVQSQDGLHPNPAAVHLKLALEGGNLNGYYSLDGGASYQRAVGSTPAYGATFTQAGILFQSGTVNVYSFKAQ